MLRQKSSYRKDIETDKKTKSKEKIELKFTIEQKQVKANFLQKILIYDDFNNKMSRHIQNVFCFF